MYCHLKDRVLDYGPLPVFWYFSFERYNGMLERTSISWNGPEKRMLTKFNTSVRFTAVKLAHSLRMYLKYIVYFTHINMASNVDMRILYVSSHAPAIAKNVHAQ